MILFYILLIVILVGFLFFLSWLLRQLRTPFAKIIWALIGCAATFVLILLCLDGAYFFKGGKVEQTTITFLTGDERRDAYTVIRTNDGTVVYNLRNSYVGAEKAKKEMVNVYYLPNTHLLLKITSAAKGKIYYDADDIVLVILLTIVAAIVFIPYFTVVKWRGWDIRVGSFILFLLITTNCSLAVVRRI